MALHWTCCVMLRKMLKRAAKFTISCHGKSRALVNDYNRMQGTYALSPSYSESTITKSISMNIALKGHVPGTWPIIA